LVDNQNQKDPERFLSLRRPPALVEKAAMESFNGLGIFDLRS